MRNLILMLVLIALASGVTARPAAAQLTLVATVDAPAEHVAVAAPYAYVASGPVVAAFDVSDPARPVAVGRLELPDRVYGMSATPDGVYLATGLAGLHIVEVSAATPGLVVRGRYATPGQAVDVAIVGRHAVVSNLMTGLEIVDVRGGDAPAAVGTVETPGYQRAVRAAAPLAFVIDQPSGVHLIDLGDPAAPHAVGLYPADDAAARYVAVQGDRLYVAYEDTGRVDIVGIDDPAAPVGLGTYQAGGVILGLALDGSTAIVPLGDAGLEVVDLTDPAAPRVVATYDTAGRALGAAVLGRTVLVADGTSLLVLALENGG